MRESVKDPLNVRKSCLTTYSPLGCFEPPPTMLERIARNDEITPGQLERAAKVAGIAGSSDREWQIRYVEQTLDKSIALLGQKRTAKHSALRTGYSLEFLNTDCDIRSIVLGLQRRHRGASNLLYTFRICHIHRKCRKNSLMGEH